nr:hypothetical protein [Tanacetum cinerariifolium]
MSSFYEFICYGCGGPSNAPLCYLCTCELCGNILIDGSCLKCNSRAGNSFTYDPTLESFNEDQRISNPPAQSHYNIYLCQICESNSHYGYECSQRVMLVYEPEPCYNQNLGDNTYPHDSPSVTPLIDHHCCYKCGDSLNDFICHQCTYEFCGNGAHDGYNCPSQVPFIQTLPSFHNINPFLNIQNEHDAHELFISKLIQQKLQNEYAQPFPATAITFDLSTMEPEYSLRMGNEHLDTVSETKSDEFIKSSVENLIPSPSESEDLSDNEYDMPACDNFTIFSNLLFDADYDFSSSNNESFSDEDISKKVYSNPLFDEEIISINIDPHRFNADYDLIESLLNHDSSIISSSSKIDSLLDEFTGELILLKSILTGIDKANYISKKICSNPLIDEEIIFINIDLHRFNVESGLIESLLNHDSSIISSSSKIDSLLDEFTGELILLMSISTGIDKANCNREEEICLIEKLWYDNSSPRPLEEFIFENSDVAIESFSPSPIPLEDSDSLMEEIDLSLISDDSMPPGIENDDHDSEWDILILEELLRNDSHSLLKNESFHFDIPSSCRPHAKPPDGDEIKPNSRILTVKVVDDISELYVPMPRL